MINIAGNQVDAGPVIGQFPLGGIEREAASIMQESSTVYRYQTQEEFLFELNVRRNIVNAAIELLRSRFSFRNFRESKCNPDYWDRTEEGGFLVKIGVSPFQAIKDIYVNSGSYGTECATAIVIIFFKALVGIFPEELFNSLFPRIYLMDWQHLDSDLGVTYIRNTEDNIPGDCRYFKNPDVDPVTPEWQGENVIVLGRGMYYGHGIGIGPAERMIEVLNRFRISGSETSAYLLDSATRQDYKYLYRKLNTFSHGQQTGIPTIPEELD